jgi:hypothetical protein
MDIVTLVDAGKPQPRRADVHLPSAPGAALPPPAPPTIPVLEVYRISGGTPEANRLHRFHPVAFLPQPFARDERLAVGAAQLPASARIR